MEAFLRGLETKFDAVSSKISSKVIPSSAVVLDLERERIETSLMSVTG